MRRRAARHGAAALAVAVLVSLAGCDVNVYLGPENEETVLSETDLFQYSVVALENVYFKRAWEWENTGTQASIEIDQSITSGSVNLTLFDVSGERLFRTDLANGVNSTTPVGFPGTWRVEIAIDGASGAFALTLRKAP